MDLENLSLSLFTLIFGLQNAFIISSWSVPSRVATFLACAGASGSHCSSRPFCLNFYKAFFENIAFLLINIYQLSEIHDSRRCFVHIPEFLLCEAEHLEGIVGELKILIVINALNLGLAL